MLATTDESRTYGIRDGVPQLVEESSVGTDDQRWNRFYDRLAPVYDLNERFWGRLLFGLDVRAERAAIVASLGLEPGGTFLEVSPGPGVMQPLFAAALGPEAEVAAVDLSSGMLRACAHRTAGQQPAPFLARADATRLPFADATFDIVFHFGGVNLFSDPAQAFAEFARVVRPGGMLFVGDEGFAPGVDTTTRKHRILARMNPGYTTPPPEPPPSLERVERASVYGGAAYLWHLRRRAE